MNLIQRDAAAIWHPFTQVELADSPVPVSQASGSWLYTTDGRRLLDATSSWWVNAHGHTHPHIVAAITRQAETLEHVIFAGFTHEPAVRLAERLLELLPGNQEKIFYSDNGSTSVEVALKMSIQYFHNQGIRRPRILAFRNAYHGDTLGGMSVAERNAFNEPFVPYLFEPVFIDAPEPGLEENSLRELRNAIANHDVAAFIFEPLVQGAAGMRMHDPDTLSSLIAICREAGVITIADEVFTGFYRTGKMFASGYLQHQPDIICLSKALTGGFLPLGVTAAPDFIFNSFRSQDKFKTFFHGHSYTANPLACSAANASLDLFTEESFPGRINWIESSLADFAGSITSHPKIRQIRHRGTILALELGSTQPSGYMNDAAAEITRWFLNQGIYIRPLGNILYITPPYCINQEEMHFLLIKIREFLDTSAYQI